MAVTRATATNAVAAPAFAFADAGSDDSATTGSILSLFDTPLRPAPTIQSKPPVKAPTAIRVGNGVAEANLIVKVQPSYPPLARSARVSGVVEFSATISKEGTIENLQLLHGHPLLVNAAKQAILRWRYRPTLLNGQPMEVLTSIVVTFTLNQ